MSDEKLNKVIERVRQLLKVAENTPHPEEASTAKDMANRLIMKYHIEEASLRSGDSNDSAFSLFDDYVYAVAPHAFSKVSFVTALSKILNVRAVYEREPYSSEYKINLYGSESDVKLIVFLYIELANYGSRQLAKLKRETGRSGRVFGQSFWMGYTSEVIERAKNALDEAIKETPGMELVLANQLEVINKEVEKLHPNLRTVTVRRSVDANAYSEGVSEGRKVDIPIRQRVNA